MSFIYFLDDISSQINLASHNFAFLGIGVVKCLGSNIYFVIALHEANSDIDEVPVDHRPNATKFHVVYFVVNIWLLLMVEKLDFLEHGVDLGQRVLLLEELNDGLDVEFAEFDSLAGDSTVNLHLVEEAWLVAVLDPGLRGFQFFETLDDFFSGCFELLLEISVLHVKIMLEIFTDSSIK